jgi:hypothetical protein
MRIGTVVAIAVLAAGCADDADDTVTVGGERVTVARLVDAHAGLCEAATSPASARALFFDRSHEALHTVARGLEDVDRGQAAALLQAKEKVESELDSRPPSLPDDLRRLADVYRASLGRLAIEAPPCDK